MFIPRQLKRKAPTDPHSNTEGVKKARLTSPLPPPNPIPSRSLAPAPDPNIQDAQHDAEILTGLSLIFSDYNRQQGENAGWLKERSRTVEGEDGWIHLSSLLTHPIFSRTRPTLTQKAIRSALERGGHAYPDLEV
ncbi:MAG: hypothetical protein M4579_007395 [Chaenotheca gracillima]|nr:MAG: hypothetical protein M4579_007395 [Chaenotheca gracillima]